MSAEAEAAIGTGQKPVSEPLHLNPEVRVDVVRRLKSSRGHLDGIERMLEDPGVYCVDVLDQVKAVQGALARVNEAVLRSHIRDHVITASGRGDADQLVGQLMTALRYRDGCLGPAHDRDRRAT